MMTLMLAAALAAQAPAAPAGADPMAQHQMPMQMGESAEHKDMDCCKDCCKHMAARHEGQATDHAGHSRR